MPDDVTELVDRCLAGQQAAMRELVERFSGPVFGLCYRMLGHRQDAEDVAQESFLRALRSLASYDRTRGFLPWLLAITGNRCRTLLATRSRRPAAVGGLERVVDSDGMDAARELAEEVRRVLAGLRPEYRCAFLLFHEQQRSYAEIGEALGCPIGTVKTWVHRARRELIEQLRKRDVLVEARHALPAV